MQPIRLQRGVEQVIPEQAVNLVEVRCNLTLNPDGDSTNIYIEGEPITPIARTVIDQMIPGWRQNDVIPYAQEVENIIDDPDSIRNFQVFPGNNGTGRIRAVVARRPDRIELPDPKPGIRNP